MQRGYFLFCRLMWRRVLGLLLQRSLISLALEFLLLHHYVGIALRHIKLCCAWAVDTAGDACDESVPKCHLALHYIVINPRQMVFNLVVLYNQTANEMVVALTGYMHKLLVVGDVSHSHLVAVT